MELLSNDMETPPTDLDSDSATLWKLHGRTNRSQSLTDAMHMRLLVQARLDDHEDTNEECAEPNGCSTTTLKEEQQRRDMRRSKSVELFSLSMLQQELGYPSVRSVSSTDARLEGRLKRASRQSHHSASIQEETNSGRPKATSDAVTIASSDMQSDDESNTEEDAEEENFLDHRLASVTGYTKDADGVIYYEIVVESTAHGPLSAYKVRRRYSEFRLLHRELSKIIPKEPASRTSTEYSHRSIAGAGHISASGFCLNSDALQSPVPSTSPNSRRSTSMSTHWTNDEAWLPPLPDNGGLWSYLQGDNPKFLETRANAFHAIIVAAQLHPMARASRLLNAFLGPPPDSFANNYVSLNRFAAPTLRFSVEIQERKEKARSISLKRRQLQSPFPVTSVVNLPAST